MFILEDSPVIFLRSRFFYPGSDLNLVNLFTCIAGISTDSLMNTLIEETVMIKIIKFNSLGTTEVTAEIEDFSIDRDTGTASINLDNEAILNIAREIKERVEATPTYKNTV